MFFICSTFVKKINVQQKIFLSVKNKITVKPTSRQYNDKPINQSHFKELKTRKINVAPLPVSKQFYPYTLVYPVLEMKIWIYWSKSSSWIHFDRVLRKTKKKSQVRAKFYSFWARGPVLIVRSVYCILKAYKWVKG